MTNSILQLVWASALLAIVGTAAPLRADDDEGPVKLTLHPMAAPTPALKYRLLPEATKRLTGNAAVPYGKVTAEEMTYFKKYAQADVIDTWQEMPLDKIRAEKIPLPESSIRFLEEGAHCRYCDWQLPIGQIPFYLIMLPDAQESRSYSRVLAVKARTEIASGKFDEAIHTFQTNYALAQNVAQGQSLIHGLIGIAIGGLMFPQITEYVQQPAAPNLYWALTAMPSPLITMTDAVEVESEALELSFPDVRDAEKASHTPEEWRTIFQSMAKNILEWNHAGDKPPVAKTPEELDKICEEALPIAQRALIASGLPKEKVDAMPVYQVATIYSVHKYHSLFDEAAKCYSLPYPQAIECIDATIARAKDPSREDSEIIPITGQTLQALRATRGAIARCDRQVALLRIVEALRLHAAGHEGKLPEKLADITEAPTPDDPVTGKPFEYHSAGDRASITGPKAGGWEVNFEITMAKAE